MTQTHISQLATQNCFHREENICNYKPIQYTKDNSKLFRSYDLFIQRIKNRSVIQEGGKVR